MGLDMYLRGEKFFWGDFDHPENDRMEDGLRVNSLDVELGYWRKHPNLHGYIVQTFAGGKDECQRIDLAKVDLAKIIVAVKENKLPPTQGFFFGVSDGTETLEDLEILTKAMEWVSTEEPKVSRTVYYQASW